MNNEYEVARAKHDEAFKAFDLIRKAYRNLEINDEEFLDAKKAYDIETQKFDTSWKKEIKRHEQLRARLHKVEGAINHWNDQKAQADYYLKERTKEKEELVQKLFEANK